MEIIMVIYNEVSNTQSVITHDHIKRVYTSVEGHKYCFLFFYLQKAILVLHGDFNLIKKFVLLNGTTVV